MPYITVNINLRHFTEKEIKIIEQMAKDRELGEKCAFALRAWLSEHNPTLAPARPQRIFIGTDKDIDTFISGYGKSTPTPTELQLKLVQGRLERALSKRPFYIDELETVLKEVS